MCVCVCEQAGMSSLFLLAQDNYHKYIASLLVAGLLRWLPVFTCPYDGVKPELGPEKGG